MLIHVDAGVIILHTIRIPAQLVVLDVIYAVSSHACATLVNNQANAIIYIKSQGSFLREHVDHRGDYDNIICTLSLGCDAVMNFRRESSSGARRAEGVPTRVLLPRRSLQIMTGDWRYRYYHSIPNENCWAREECLSHSDAHAHGTDNTVQKTQVSQMCTESK
jgi:2OG-Fe(II) oxygenase superfamily